MRRVLTAALLACVLPVRAEWSWVGQTNTLALLDGSRIAWQLNFNPAEGKPYLHPVTGPDGTVLTELRPGDHPWHRGIWWSWKFIDGLNYWEEDRKTGQSDGLTVLRTATMEPASNHAAIARFELDYQPPGKPVLLTEKRRLEFSAPDARGSFTIGWESVFTCGSNAIELSRTPLPDEPNGKSWGGYAGLSLRLSQATRTWTISNSAGQVAVKGVHGQPAEWMRIASPTSNVAITVTSDPSNLRHPQPWYAAQGNMNFFQPAPLFRAPLKLAAGEVLTLRYTIAFQFD